MLCKYIFTHIYKHQRLRLFFFFFNWEVRPTGNQLYLLTKSKPHNFLHFERSEMVKMQSVYLSPDKS